MPEVARPEGAMRAQRSRIVNQIVPFASMNPCPSCLPAEARMAKEGVNPWLPFLPECMLAFRLVSSAMVLRRRAVIGFVEFSKPLGIVVAQSRLVSVE